MLAYLIPVSSELVTSSWQTLEVVRRYGFTHTNCASTYDQCAHCWSNCSPLTKANRYQSLARSLLDFRMWELSQTVPLVGGFSLVLPVLPAFHSATAPFPPHFTFMGSQDLIVFLARSAHRSITSDTAMRIECVIAAKCKALMWCAVLQSHCTNKCSSAVNPEVEVATSSESMLTAPISEGLSTICCKSFISIACPPRMLDMQTPSAEQRDCDKGELGPSCFSPELTLAVSSGDLFPLVPRWFNSITHSSSFWLMVL
ncbi:hypothetical protein PR048_007770 [Dryococelus australis]|uniref:Uncharacterized protein n=1 Tax=Dryococelus australis TaxID=614101 RepID=A0ABQ9HV71_9NEOP|nr:hypothetical protein PR048_007770 [Dryococelus australis]